MILTNYTKPGIDSMESGMVNPNFQKNGININDKQELVIYSDDLNSIKSLLSGEIKISSDSSRKKHRIIAIEITPDKSGEFVSIKIGNGKSQKNHFQPDQTFFYDFPNKITDELFLTRIISRSEIILNKINAQNRVERSTSNSGYSTVRDSQIKGDYEEINELLGNLKTSDIYSTLGQENKKVIQENVYGTASASKPFNLKTTAGNDNRNVTHEDVYSKARAISDPAEYATLRKNDGNATQENVYGMASASKPFDLKTTEYATAGNDDRNVTHEDIYSKAHAVSDPVEYATVRKENKNKEHGIPGANEPLIAEKGIAKKTNVGSGVTNPSNTQLKSDFGTPQVSREKRANNDQFKELLNSQLKTQLNKRNENSKSNGLRK